MYKIINTGSEGNAVLYGSILVDCGVGFAKLRPFKKEIQIVLLTHQHKDHINIKTLQRLQKERPTLRVATPEYLIPLLSGLDNIDVLEIGKLYDYGTFKVSPVKLYHDVPNVGYRIFLKQKADGLIKIFHATDTAHLENIEAKNYDLYAIEHNYDEEKANKAIEEAIAEGRFCHARGSIETHLSWQQAQEFIRKNRKESSEILELHKSKTFY